MQKILFLFVASGLLLSGCQSMQPSSRCMQLKRELFYSNTNPNAEARMQSNLQRDGLKQQLADCNGS